MAASPPIPSSFVLSEGLVLDRSPEEVGGAGAIDLLDVDWDLRGVLGSRMGAAALFDGLAHNYDVIFGADVLFGPLGEEFALLARRGETLVALDEEGAEGDSLAVSTGRLNFAQIGTGVLTPVTYIANQNEQVRKFFDGSFSSPTATVDGEAGNDMPRAHYVADWQDGANRLVVFNTTLEGGPAGAAGSPSHVFFSEPGQPESFKSTSFVELNPGDGQQGVACVVWGRQTFAFKETYVCVFYGISADEEGESIFNFRTVDLGTRALAQRGSGSPNVVAGRDGVYFIARDGIWVTTGGLPTLVTGSLDFGDDRRNPRAELGGAPFPTWEQAKGLAYLDDCLYVGFGEEAGEGAIPIKRVLKVDLVTGRVTYWSTNLSGFTVWASTWEGEPRLHFSGAGEDAKGIYLFTPATDDDAVVEMNPYYESGSYDLGDSDEKTLVGTKVWGSGTVDIAAGEDFAAPRSAKTYELGTGAAIAQHQRQLGQTATFFNHRISGTAPWTLQRLVRYLQSSRVTETQK